ncbi:MAG TPA: rhodanese-like domain-containing protein [Bacteroidales bacterium]|nr:rhodanese-like domain-containing protein [Bacteroidales bacterium]
MRIKISILLLILGLILVFLPLSGKYSLHGSPAKLLTQAIDPSTYMTPDQVAKAIVSEDSTIRIFDLRSQSEFTRASIPGAINLPYSEFLKRDLESFLNSGVKNLFYSSNDLEANYALILARGLGYSESYVMKGGLEAWDRDIMNSTFSGDRISVRENALFETRTRARKMFIEINSMPDSLKTKYRATLEVERKKLDGGCE